MTPRTTLPPPVTACLTRSELAAKRRRSPTSAPEAAAAWTSAAWFTSETTVIARTAEDGEEPAADGDRRRRPSAIGRARISRRTSGSRVAARISARTTGISDERHRHEDADEQRREPDGDQDPPAPGRDAIEPGRHQGGELRPRPGIEDRDGRARDGEHDGGDRHRGEQADDARELVACRQDDEDHRRVDVDALAVDRRPDAVAQDRVADPDQHEQRDHGDRPPSAAYVTMTMIPVATNPPK